MKLLFALALIAYIACEYNNSCISHVFIHVTLFLIMGTKLYTHTTYCRVVKPPQCSSQDPNYDDDDVILLGMKVGAIRL